MNMQLFEALGNQNSDKGELKENNKEEGNGASLFGNAEKIQEGKPEDLMFSEKAENKM
jgi:hypothetical protein